MVVYIDLIFATNLLVDAVTLYMTAWLRKTNVRTWRIFAGAGLGACYVLMMFVPALSIMFTFLVKCLFSALMIMTTFGFRSLQAFLRTLAAFYLVNFAAAAAIFAVFYLSRSPSELMNGALFTHTGLHVNIGSVLIVIGFGVGLIVLRSVFRQAERKSRQQGYMAEVRVWIEGEETVCQGLIDTGNHLYDPLTRAPVIIMEASLWERFLPSEWMPMLAMNDADRIVNDKSLESFVWRDRLRLVPYRGVNRGTNFMLALKPDRIVVTLQGETYETEKALVGLNGGKLSHEGAYQAILHPDLVDMGKSDTDPIGA